MRSHRFWVVTGALSLLVAPFIIAPSALARSDEQGSPVPCGRDPAIASGAKAEAASEAEAEPDAPPATTIDEQIVVTADRLESDRQRVGSSVTVIDEAEIARRRKHTVAELLRTVPGLEINRSAGPGSVTSAFLRGGSSAFTLVLVDGVRMNSPATGSFDLSQLSTDNIDRIEVVRGPASTLYGSEAIGGVISITTARGAGPLALEAALEAGNDGFDHQRAGVRGSRGVWDYSLAAGRTTTGGISAAAARFGNREDDGDTNRTLSARFGRALGVGGRLDLALRQIDGDTEIDGFGFDPVRGFVPVDDPNARQSQRATVASIDARVPLGERITQTLRLGLHDETLVARDPDTPLNNFASDTQVLTLGAITEVSLFAHGTLIVGIEHETREARVRDSFDRDLDIDALFVQQRWASDRGSLVLGLRHDDHQSFGGETTWRVTGSWSWPGATGRGPTRVHSSAGSGFRAPSLNELFFPFFGNPALLPETSTGFDLGIERTLLDGRLRIDLTAFANDYDQLIGVGPAFTAVNIDQANARGAELTLDWTPSVRWALGISHSFTDTENETSGLALARRPKNRSVVTFTFDPMAHLDGALTLLAVRDRIDTGGAPMDDYERLDLSLGWRLRPRLRLDLRAENLLDQDYEEVPGFGTPGLLAAIGLHWSP